MRINHMGACLHSSQANPGPVMLMMKQTDGVQRLECHDCGVEVPFAPPVIKLAVGPASLSDKLKDVIAHFTTAYARRPTAIFLDRASYQELVTAAAQGQATLPMDFVDSIGGMVLFQGVPVYYVNGVCPHFTIA